MCTTTTLSSLVKRTPPQRRRRTTTPCERGGSASSAAPFLFLRARSRRVLTLRWKMEFCYLLSRRRIPTKLPSELPSLEGLAKDKVASNSPSQLYSLEHSHSTSFWDVAVALLRCSLINFSI